ncbi:MAG: hypothetical protein LBN41_05930 [Enterobacteriaceae bacterium]|jgi:hypothetical protein|nr:hypothetical protein [Enterobacteriaceae bacterium]
MITENKYQLHYTHQFINMLTEAVNHSRINLNWFHQQILPSILRYPYQGRLFLNRNSTDSDSQRLRKQLAQRFNCNELRELSENGWLILYLNKFSQIYLLALIPLSMSVSLSDNAITDKPGNKIFEKQWVEKQWQDAD